MHTIATRLGRKLDERYVAPEVWLDPASASPASDIYSLGILYHELLTGQTPCQKVLEVCIAKEVKSSLGGRRPELGEEAERLFQAMCAFEPAKRTTDLGEIQDRIERLI